MLLLTKLDQTKVLVPLEAVKYIEETPDTLIRFLNGEHILVKESLVKIQNLATSSQPTHTTDVSHNNSQESCVI